MQNKITVVIAGNQYTILADETPAYMQAVARRTEVFMQEARHLNGGNAYGTGVLATLNATDVVLKTEHELQKTRAEMTELPLKLAEQTELCASLRIENEKNTSLILLQKRDLEQLESKLKRREAQVQLLKTELADREALLTDFRSKVENMKDSLDVVADETLPPEQTAQEEIKRLRAELNRQVQMNTTLQKRNKR